MSAITGRYDFGFFVGLELKGKKHMLDWCKSMNLISSEYECPDCKSQMILEEKSDDIDGYVWVCRQEEEENKHFIERSVRQGSFFQQSDLSILNILLLTYLWVKKATCEFIEDELDLSKEIVDEWLNFCSEVCVEICLNKNTMVGGENVIVEINECKFQEKTFKRNDIVGGWVYVGFEKETDKGFFEVVYKKSQRKLLSVIKKYILPGTILVSDCWKLYDCLDAEGFVDLKESQNIKFEDLGIGIGSTIIGLRRSVKRTIDNVERVSHNFDLCVAEYMWRRTHSDNPYELIRAFLEEIIIFFPPDIKDN